MSFEFARFRDITEYSTNAMFITNENHTATLRSGTPVPHRGEACTVYDAFSNIRYKSNHF